MQLQENRLESTDFLVDRGKILVVPIYECGTDRHMILRNTTVNKHATKRTHGVNWRVHQQGRDHLPHELANNPEYIRISIGVKGKTWKRTKFAAMSSLGNSIGLAIASILFCNSNEGISASGCDLIINES